MFGQAPFGSVPFGAPSGDEPLGAAIGHASGAGAAAGVGSFTGALIQEFVSTKWRVYVLANGGTQAGFNEVEMAATAGGANLCTGGTPIASGAYGGTYTADGAFDGSRNSPPSWYTSGVLGAWIGYEFAAPVGVSEFRLARGDADLNGTPVLMAFQYYDAPTTTWKTAWFGYREVWANNNFVSFQLPYERTDWPAWGAVNLDGAGGNKDTVLIALTMQEFSGGPDVTVGGSAHAYHVNSGYVAANAFDRNPNTVWYSGDASQASIIWYDFGVPEIISEFTAYADLNGGNLTRALGTGSIVGTSDGRNFRRVSDYALVEADYTPAPGVNVKQATIPIQASGPIGMVGTATATSSAAGIYTPLGFVKGVATATSTAAATAFALGTISTVGSALGQGSAPGATDPIRPMAGAATATSTTDAISLAIGTISTDGTASALGSAGSGSFATGIISAVGAASGAASAPGVGTGRLQSSGSAAATSSAHAGGSYRPSPGTGSAGGTSLATAIAVTYRIAIGAARAGSEALARAASVIPAVGSAQGKGSTYGATNINQPSVGAASAGSSADGRATGLAPAVGAASATSSAIGASRALSPAIGTAGGVAAANGTGRALAERIGVSEAKSSAVAVTSELASGAGAATATITAAGVSVKLIGGRGSATGASVADGRLSGAATGAGTTHATSTAQASSVVIGHFAPGPRVVLVDARDKVVTVPAAGSRVVVVAPRDKVVIVQRQSRMVSAA